MSGTGPGTLDTSFRLPFAPISFTERESECEDCPRRAEETPGPRARALSAASLPRC